MFTDTQLSIYESSKDFIFIRLNNLINRSKSDSNSLKAFFFQLKVTLEYNRTYTDYMGQVFYPSHSNIKLFFSELNDLLLGNAPEHKFVTSLCDPRFFSKKNNNDEYKQALSKEFSKKLKQDISEWFTEEFKKTELTDRDLAALHTKYPPELVNYRANTHGKSSLR